MDRFYTIWPDKRFVSADQIQIWFSDAVANGEMADDFITAIDTETMARGLHDAGLITLGKSRESFL